MKSKLTIVHVEDNPAHAELVSRGLEGIDIDVELIWLSDGEKVVNYLEDRSNETPQMILLDLNLPKIKGLEVLKIIRESHRHKTVPVVVLSTSEAENDIAGAYEHMANSYLVKPLNFIDFQKMVSDCGSYWTNWNRTLPA